MGHAGYHDRPGRRPLRHLDYRLGRWFIWLVGVFQIAYRPGFWYPEAPEYLAITVLLAVANGLVHYRLLTNRPVTWRWLLLLGAVDITLITAGIVIAGSLTPSAAARLIRPRGDTGRRTKAHGCTVPARSAASRT